LTEFEDDSSDDAPKVFISHHSKDRGAARLLGYQVEADQYGVEAEDNSPKRPYRGNWKTPMTAKIGDSDVVIVVVGEDTHTRAAVKWELKTAKKLGKPVYAVKIKGDERVPREVYDAGGKVVDWNMEAIKYEIHYNT